MWHGLRQPVGCTSMPEAKKNPPIDSGEDDQYSAVKLETEVSTPITHVFRKSICHEGWSTALRPDLRGFVF